MTKVFLRPRPLASSEQGDALVRYEFESGHTVAVHTRDSVQRFQPFSGVLSSTNSDAYAEAIRPLLPSVLTGGTACCFAYGHTNSGKTHTIFGYGPERGMYLHAVTELFATAPPGLLLQVRFYELYNGKVYDLLNARSPGFVREDADGTIHVRSETTMGPNGEVRTQSLRALYCSSAEAVEEVVRLNAATRVQGTSELHGQSSRSHAVLELEIVTLELSRAREELVKAKARVVPVGKARDDLFIAIQSKLYQRGEDGKYIVVGEPSADDTEKLSRLEAQVQAAQQIVHAAQARVATTAMDVPNIGGMLVFVDLAGAEYTGEGLQRNSKELREAKEINASLLALKECIRAQAAGSRHTPYRNAKLTMLLRGHLDPVHAGTTVMIATVSSSLSHATKAVNTLKYAALVADAFQAAQER